MKFEKALQAMRESKVVKSVYGDIFKIDNGLIYVNIFGKWESVDEPENYLMSSELLSSGWEIVDD